MIPESLDPITLRLLRLFETVYRTRNVSHAADQLDVSQPSVSLSLNRLREHFEDPLFVRVGSRMEPTPRAEELIDPIRSILSIANDEFVSKAPFDPAKSDRCFILHMTDLGETLLVPKLIDQLAIRAPGISLKVRNISEDSQAQLANGNADLILGYLSRESDDLFQRKLFDEHFVCLVRLGHPRICGALDREKFRAERHINVAISGTGHLQIEKTFDQERLSSDPMLELPGFLAIGEAVEHTDLIAAVPSRLAQDLVKRRQLQVFSLPFESPEFQVRQYWHARFHHDAGNQWLRQVIVDLFN